MNNLIFFLYGTLHKFSAMGLALGLFQLLKFSGLIDGFKGEFYYIPALILMIAMILLFSRYLSDMTSRNLLILGLCLATGLALIYIL